ncbi:TIGR04222 domain-containing membrane protein, partial [Streptomyces sp. GC420]|uniref:TIGR04222 domain-containing membrane protein n=1 Tax=Streptomyces sp. GC420 TaxID=2697568 RepID=UPI00141508BA
MILLLVLCYLVLGGLAVAAVTAAVRANRVGRNAPADRRVRDVLEAAFLAGGPGRVADTVIAAMHARGRLVLAGPGIVRIEPGVVPEHPVEEALLTVHASAPSGALQWLRAGVMRSQAVQGIGDLLAARGLLAPPRTARGARTPAAILAALSFLGFPVALVLTFLQYVAFESDTDLELPFVLLLAPGLITGLIIGLVCGSMTGRRITPAGRQALREYGPATHGSTDPAQQVAVGGVRMVADPLLRAHLSTAARARGGARHVTASSPSHTHSPSSSGDHFPVVVWCGSGGSGGGCGAGGG